MNDWLPFNPCVFDEQERLRRMKKVPMLVIVRNAAGQEVARLRGDRMNYGAACVLVAGYEAQHGHVTFDVVDLPDVGAANANAQH